MRVLASMALLLWAGSVGAQGSATLVWTPPTENVDGSVYDNAAGYKLYWGTQPGTYPNSLQIPDTTAWVLNGLAPATWFFVVTAVAQDGKESAPSNVATKTIGGTGQLVTQAGPVLTLQITRDSIVAPQVGTVVAGRPCDGSQSFSFGGKTYYRVDVSRVVPFPGMQIEAAWALCSVN